MGATMTAAKARIYMPLLAIQTLAVIVLLLGLIPIYDAVLGRVGHQITKLPQSPLLLFAILLLFHCAYWFRLKRVPLAVTRRSLVLSHVVSFAGRLSFVFGTSFFALIMYRHLPAMTSIPDPSQLAARIAATLFILFSLYCYSAELERLAIALRPLAEAR
jgi:hypothetical protein